MEWYPTPSYLVKRRAILDFIATLEAGTFLEVGCGAGDLVALLGERGMSGLGVDIAAEALDIARTRLRSTSVSVEQRSVEEVSGEFDLVIASEVLEHYEDDVAFLRLLRDRVREGGHLLLTVPAHMEKWGANDELCGHVRRYSRQELEKKLVAAGLVPLAIRSYGVPIYNIMKPFYDRAVAGKREPAEGQVERTRKSSGVRLFPGLGWLFHLLFNDVTMYPFYFIQRRFYATDLGNGYFVAARKSGSRGVSL
jgi:SAM-dependent methyltransferase